MGQALVADFGGLGSLHAQKSEKKGKKEKKAKDQTDAPKAVDPRLKQKIDYLFIEAGTSAMQEKYQEAITLYKQVTELDPSNHAALYNIGRLSFQLEKYEDAMRYGKMALDLNPENYWYYADLVRACEGARDLKKALEYQAKLCAKFPDEKSSKYDLAQLYILNKDYPKAISTYEELENLAGSTEEISFRKHQLYVYTNQPDLALKELDGLIAANPTESRFWQAKHDLLMMLNREDEAFKTLEELLRLEPNNGFALLAMADAYKAKGDFKSSDEFLFKAFENPDVNLETKVQILGGLYQIAEQDSQMLARIDRMSRLLLAQQPKSAIVIGIRADVLQAMGQLDSAKTYYRQSAKLDPSNPQVWEELLLIDLEDHDHKSLQKDAEKALEYYPNQVFFLYCLGYGAMQSGDHEEAIYAFEKVKKTGEKDKNLMLQTHLSLGEVYHKEERYSESDKSFEAAMALSPNDPLVLNNYAYFLSLRNERLADASKMVQEALAKEPENGAYQDTYGWILYLQGNYQEASKWLLKAINKGGGAEVMEHYGDVQAKLGDLQTAKTYWQRAIDNGAAFKLESKMKDF
jgi:tetratricopeptide (TPR) repeat protein